MGICDGRVVDRDRRRARPRAAPTALAFAAEGAKVVVNDLGASLTGDAHRRVARARRSSNEIVAAGGEAVVNGDDVSDWDGAGRLVAQAIDTFGGLDTVVCNAGIVRDRMIVNMSVEEWDAVIRVHLRGVFCPVRHADRLLARRAARPASQRDARIVTTSSGAGLRGSIAQANYVAAKAGIAAFTHQRRRRARSLRRARQHHRPVGPQPHDRGGDAGDDGEARDRLRRDGPGQRVAVRGVARQRRLRRHRPRVRDGGRRRVRDERLAAAVRRSTRAPAASPPRWARCCAGSSREAPEPEAVHGT